ncbi:PREDICTED: NLR family CARD domain-containing protein 4 isoform X2 [Calidris pugnax]|uniref:NLR family CARD domain-containing protein 4 isoform X2 n=1 Tax=Calidris pugnax TaxID=198806 RepID=UPI00071D3744|nr:PREDICTED: NLR family CARD domain-containing protein 4 isoform X2 [Calidris pugnax]
MEFIESNRGHLIQRMGMITVKKIADDLLACRVMSYEEVNTITCERVEQEASRMMIYMILNKGSEACNILVKSLEKHNPFLFHDLQGDYTPGQVEQDKLNDLIQDLKYVYLSSAFQKYHPLGSDIDIIFDLGTAYTDILLWKKDIQNSRKGQLTLNVLLEELKNPCIIEGEAGKGKTTLLKRIAVLWASENCSALKKFQFVFFISLASTRGGIYETVCDQLLFEQYPIRKQDFMKMLLAQRQRVLFLLDGYDEFNPPNCPEIEAMIKENHKFKNMVIIATRTESIHKIRQFGSLVAEIGDLSEESCKKLIKNVLTNKLADGLLNQLKEATSMKNLMKTPLFVIIACAIQMGESNFHPSTQTLLFSTLYDLMVEKNRYLPNCLSVLGLIKLDFFGNYSPSKEIDDENVEDLQISSLKTYIPEKAVSLFFNWNQSLRSLEITLQDFNKLKKRDIKYLGKICCSAASLKLHISNSAGITGTLNEVLETCKNLQDLTVESTPLTVEDEQQITTMTKLKTLHIRDLQSENLEGGLIDGIKKLVNAEGLVLDNISMDEDDAKKLAEGIRNLRKLRLLYMSHLTAIRDGITYIVRSVSDDLRELEEIRLVNCCISSDAVEILAQNLCNLPKLNVLDLSENYLEKRGEDAIHRLVDGLNVLPGMKVLMLPWGDDVKVCLTKLLELLETMPQLTKLGLRKWSLTDVEIRILGNFFEKEHLQNLQHLDLAMNCVTSDGWLSFMQTLISVKKLVSVDFSSEQDWVPASLLVCKLSQVLTTLNYLKEIKVTGWKFDCHDLGLINDAKINCRKQFQLVHS